MQKTLIKKQKAKVEYHSEFINKIGKEEQHIRLSDGCFRSCWNCYAPKKKTVYPIPHIVRNKVVFYDMNFLWAYPEPLSQIEFLGYLKVNNKVVYYDFWCGLDYTLITLEIAKALYKNRFGRFNNKRKFIKGIRIAWDRGLKEQKKVVNTIKLLIKAGYDPKNIQCFMLCNGAVPYYECVLKRDLLLKWNVQIADCWYNNQKRGSVKPEFWNKEECVMFGRLCRNHDHLINYGIYPEVSE